MYTSQSYEQNPRYISIKHTHDLPMYVGMQILLFASF